MMVVRLDLRGGVLRLDTAMAMTANGTRAKATNTKVAQCMKRFFSVALILT
ncbi:hypothetical protein TIFTF001_018455 [Ficus carica]|uniref:Uncharacterized protein n=1 Tax=Ficus carica TaxID=3494 RepID=A0AA88A4C5_FICCA|nr:hypothetical protein TIFTF001_018455 [Ficus carica]